MPASSAEKSQAASRVKGVLRQSLEGVPPALRLRTDLVRSTSESLGRLLGRFRKGRGREPLRKEDEGTRCKVGTSCRSLQVRLPSVASLVRRVRNSGVPHRAWGHAAQPAPVGARSRTDPAAGARTDLSARTAMRRRYEKHSFRQACIKLSTNMRRHADPGSRRFRFSWPRREWILGTDARRQKGIGNL